MKLNLGCGTAVPDGWVNVDYALGARIAKLPGFNAINSKLRLFNQDWDEKIYLHNLVKPLPWPGNSVEAAYSSHTLEHMTRDQGRHFLEQIHRVLKPNGIIRIVVPDLKHDVMQYLEGHIKAEDFVEHLDVLYLNKSNPIKNMLAPFYQFPHKCMYDHERLLAILEEVGFKVEKRGARDSDIPGIEEVELEERTVNAVIVEGHKIST